VKNSDFSVIRAGELREGDYVVHAKFLPIDSDEPLKDADLVGFWIAEGWRTNGGSFLFCNSKLKLLRYFGDRVTNIKKMPNNKYQKTDVYRARIVDNALMKQFLRKGNGYYKTALPILKYDESSREKFLQWWCIGDGSKASESGYRVLTIHHEDLRLEAWLIFLSLRKPVTWQRQFNIGIIKPNPWRYEHPLWLAPNYLFHELDLKGWTSNFAKHKLSCNKHYRHSINRIPKDLYQHIKRFVNEDIGLARVKKIRKFHYKGKVYDISVEGVERFFTAMGIGVHNSMYPNLMIAFNLSPETIITDTETKEDYIEVNNIKIRQKPEGVLPKTIKRLMTVRKQLKKELETLEPSDERYSIVYQQQYSIKQIINAIYGTFAYPNFRLYTPEISATTTYLGRTLIKLSIEKAKEMGYQALYSDTDSLFLHLGENVTNVQQKVFELEQTLNNAIADELYRRWGIENPPKLEYEKTYDIFLSSGKKKRYAGHIIDKGGKPADEIEIKGFEFRRSDSAIITREIQKELFERILKGQSQKEISEWLIDFINNFDKLPLEKIAIPQPLRQDPFEYDRPAQRKAVIWTNKHFNTHFTNGSRPLKVILKRFGSYDPYIEIDGQRYKVNEVCLIDGKLPDPSMEVDYQQMLEKTVGAKIRDVLSIIGIDWDTLITGKRQTNLFEWG